MKLTLVTTVGVAGLLVTVSVDLAVIRGSRILPVTAGGWRWASLSTCKTTHTEGSNSYYYSYLWVHSILPKTVRSLFFKNFKLRECWCTVSNFTAQRHASHKLTIYVAPNLNVYISEGEFLEVLLSLISQKIYRSFVYIEIFIKKILSSD